MNAIRMLLWMGIAAVALLTGCARAHSPKISGQTFEIHASPDSAFLLRSVDSQAKTYELRRTISMEIDDCGLMRVHGSEASFLTSITVRTKRCRLDAQGVVTCLEEDIAGWHTVGQLPLVKYSGQITGSKVISESEFDRVWRTEGDGSMDPVEFSVVWEEHRNSNGELEVIGPRLLP